MIGSGLLLVYVAISRCFGAEVIFPTDMQCPFNFTWSATLNRCVPDSLKNLSVPLSEKLIAEAEKCWAEGKLYKDGKCYNPTSKGPCPEEHWLVLSEDQKDSKYLLLSAFCSKRPCQSNEVFLKNGGCRSLLPKNQEKSLCDQNEVLVNNVFGYGVCICRMNPLHAKWPADRRCYPLYRQGPCAQGEYLVVNPNATSDGNSLKCVPNPCFIDGFVSFNSTCQELGSTCENSTREVQIDTSTFEAKCIETTREVARVPPNCSSSRYIYSCYCRGCF